MQIDVKACNGGLGAQLLINGFTPEDSQALFGDVASLHTLLSRSGIPPEFMDKPSLQLVHNLLSHPEDGRLAETLEEIHSIIVASGVAPTDDEMLGLRMAREYLSSEEELTDLKCRLASEPYETTEKSVNPKSLVNVGDLILGFSGIKKGVPGIGVFGAAIPTGPENSALPKPGNSIFEEANKWVALKRGVLVVEDNTLKILGPRNAEHDYILVSEDKLSVRLLLRSEEGDDFKPTLKFLEQIILERHLHPRPPWTRFLRPSRRSQPPE